MPDTSSTPTSSVPTGPTASGVAASPGMGLFGPDLLADSSVCSRKGCRVTAIWVLRWNNPRIHPPERRKSWASCQEHVTWFEEYLGERGLWKETVPLTGAPPSRSAGNS